MPPPGLAAKEMRRRQNALPVYGVEPLRAVGDGTGVPLAVADVDADADAEGEREGEGEGDGVARMSCHANSSPL